MKIILIILLLSISKISFSEDTFHERLGFQVFQNLNIQYKEYGIFDPLKVAREFGVPLEIIRWEVSDDREPGIYWRVEKWIWKGLEITVEADIFLDKKVPHKKSLWIQEVVVTNEKYEVFGGGRVGMSKNSFLKTIRVEGLDIRQSKSHLEQSFVISYKYKIQNSGGTAAGHVEITVFSNAKGKVHKVRWGYFAD